MKHTQSLCEAQTFHTTADSWLGFAADIVLMGGARQAWQREDKYHIEHIHVQAGARKALLPLCDSPSYSSECIFAVSSALDMSVEARSVWRLAFPLGSLYNFTSFPFLSGTIKGK